MSVERSIYGSLDEDHGKVPLDEKNLRNVVSKENQTLHLRGFILLAVGFFSVAAFLSSGQKNSMSSLLNEYPQHFRSDDELSVTACNEYGDTSSGKSGYPFMEDAILLEPNRDNYVNITEIVSGCKYDWILTGPSAYPVDDQDIYSGHTEDGQLTVAPKIVGKYNLSISESCDNEAGRTLLQTVWVKYVRRELSTLTDSDREEFLDAFATLWTLNTVDGKAKFGETYKSLFYFATLHNDGGANSVCDEFHGGLGFVNNHLYLSAYLEQSLQLINPKTSLHYMEYTKYFSDGEYNSHIKNVLDGGSWTEIMTSKFFGSTDPTTGRIADGRWAGIQIPTLSDDFFVDHDIDPDKTFFPVEEDAWLQIHDAHLSSPYGLLRSPWNYNPDPYTIRYNSVHQMNATFLDKNIYKYYMGVTCDDYSKFLSTKVVGHPFSDYLHGAEDDVHGIVHFTVGGAGGDYANAQNDILQEVYGFDDTNIVIVSQAAQTFFKFVVPFDYPDGRTAFEDTYGIPYPLNCSSDPWQDGKLTTTAYPMEEGGPSCGCADYFFESEDNLQGLIDFFFSQYLDSTTPQNRLVRLINGLDFGNRTTVMQIICSRMAFDGDMAGSGAATDPLFWVVHGSVERLLHRVMFENVMTDTYYALEDQICSGHHRNASKAWLKGFSFEDKSVVAENLTNGELSDILNPTGSQYESYISFLYDDTSYSFCDDEASWFTVDADDE